MAISINRKKSEHIFYVIHPLDDIPEMKRNVNDLGPMLMTKSVRLSLMMLRGYLVTMIVLVGYHVLCLAKVIGQ